MKQWVSSTYARTLLGHYTELAAKYPLVTPDVSNRITHLVEQAFSNREVELYCEDNGHQLVETPVGKQCSYCKVLMEIYETV